MLERLRQRGCRPMEWELFHVERFHSETSVGAEGGKVQRAAKASSRGHWERLGCRQRLAASCPLPPPSGQSRGDDSICKPAPSTSSQHTQTPHTQLHPRKQTSPLQRWLLATFPYVTAVQRTAHIQGCPLTHGRAQRLREFLKAGSRIGGQGETQPLSKRAGGFWGSAGWPRVSSHPAR